MGYLIVRRTVGSTQYLGWMSDTERLEPEMNSWLGRAVTTEILEYVPNIDPRTDTNLIPQLNLWSDHTNKEKANGL